MHPNYALTSYTCTLIHMCVHAHIPTHTVHACAWHIHTPHVHVYRLNVSVKRKIVQSQKAQAIVLVYLSLAELCPFTACVTWTTTIAPIVVPFHICYIILLLVCRPQHLGNGRSLKCSIVLLAMQASDKPYNNQSIRVGNE